MCCKLFRLLPVRLSGRSAAPRGGASSVGAWSFVSTQSIRAEIGGQGGEFESADRKVDSTPSTTTCGAVCIYAPEQTDAFPMPHLSGRRTIRILSAEPEPPEIVPCIRCGGTGHNKSAAPPPTHDKALRPDNRKSDMKERFDLFRAPCPASPQRWAKRLSAACGKCFRRWRPMFAYARLRRSQLTAAPTVSAITAPRAPSGFSWPTVESRAVWCSTSELSSAPTSTTMVESHIHIIRPTTAPSAP